MAVDKQGNIYVAGWVSGVESDSNSRGEGTSLDFGHGVQVQPADRDQVALLLKYGADGKPQWARVATKTDATVSFFHALALDGKGNVFAAGTLFAGGGIDLGQGVKVAGSYSGENALLVKYSSAGKAQWARSTRSATLDSSLSGLAVDQLGAVYAAGTFSGAGPFDFGNGVKVGSTSPTTEFHALLLKYDASGKALWARTESGGGSDSEFDAVALGRSGPVAVGYIRGPGTFVFGPKASATGTDLTPPEWHPSMVAYAANGSASWAKAAHSESGTAHWRAIAVTNGIAVVGEMHLNLALGNAVETQAEAGGRNLVIASYDASGDPVWVQSMVKGIFTSSFFGVVADEAGYLYAGGEIQGFQVFDLGNAVEVQGSAAGLGPSGGASLVLVKYAPPKAPGRAP